MGMRLYPGATSRSMHGESWGGRATVRPDQGKSRSRGRRAACDVGLGDEPQSDAAVLEEVAPRADRSTAPSERSSRHRRALDQVVVVVEPFDIGDAVAELTGSDRVTALAR